jgi:C_GCAxxG_C_C family probable redox protein
VATSERGGLAPTVESAKDHAVALFDAGYNCAESAVMALLAAAGRDAREAQRLATAFGGGLARRGGVCGAVSGAAMALSAMLGRSDPKDREGKERVYAAVTALVRGIEEAHGSVECRRLTGLDWSDPSSDEVFKATVKHQVCIPVLRLAVALALEERRAALPQPGE